MQGCKVTRCKVQGARLLERLLSNGLSFTIVKSAGTVILWCFLAHVSPSAHQQVESAESRESRKGILDV